MLVRPTVVLGALLLAGSIHAQGDTAWSTATPVDLLMVDDRFVPDQLKLRQGVAYRIHMENHGRDLHEFTAPEFLATVVVHNRGVLANEGKEVVVQPGQAIDLYLMPLKMGTYRLICADHDWDGMVGEIVVQ
jgi:uncharacterized cupredoxin-like copper-binding protein